MLDPALKFCKKVNDRVAERAVVAISALLVVAVVASGSILIVQNKNATLTDRQRETNHLLNSAEASINRSLLSVDLLLAQTGKLLAMANASGTSAVKAIDSIAPVEQANEVLRSLATQSLLIRHVTILRHDGVILNSSDGNARRLAAELPNKFLEEVVAQAGSGLSMSSPVLSFARSERVVYLARLITLGNDEPAIALAEVSISRLTANTVRSIAFDGLEITLERTTGELLASEPSRETLLGTKLVPPLDGRTTKDGEFAALNSRIIGLPAMVAARPTLYPGLLVTASLPIELALAESEPVRRSIVWGTVGSVLLIMGLGALIRSYLYGLSRARREIAASKATVDEALESMAEGFLLLDADEKLVTWNRRFLEIHPWLVNLIAVKLPYRDCVARTAEALFPSAIDARSVTSVLHDRWILDNTRPGNVRNTRRDHQFPDGRIIRVTERLTPVNGMVAIFTDITLSELQQAEILAGKADLQATLDAIPDLIYEIGLDGRYYGYHSPSTELSATRPEDVIGKRVSEVLPVEAAAVVMSALSEAMDARVSLGKQLELDGLDGKRWFELSVSRKPLPNGHQPMFIVISRDVTATRSAAAEIEALAFFDPLTNLPNRRLLMDRLKQTIVTCARNRRAAAVIFIDLDRFKTLNDSMGHAVGDKLLVQVATRLLMCVRRSDTVARLGGDEFVVILMSVGTEPVQASYNAGVISEKIRLALAEPYCLDHYEYTTTASLGITLLNGDDSSADDVLRHADIAMYQAKDSGRNTVRFYNPYMQSVINKRVELEKDLRAALVLNQFQLHYQLQVDNQGYTVGAEALIRWFHPERGLVMPGEFIPFAEETGIIASIGKWVLEAACAQLKRWADHPQTHHLRLSLNVSALQFKQVDFATQVLDTITRSGANPRQLTLELTESVMLNDVEDSIMKMQAISACGVGFSIDDFGTGHSSLSYLTRLPFAQLKIAQPFVEKIGAKTSDAVVVQTIIGMAKNLGIEVIAEGVETDEQHAFLAKQGCLLFQGYLFGRPVPIEDFERKLLRMK